MTNPDAPSLHSDSTDPAASPLDRLTRAQVFSRDPEAMTLEILDRAIAELKKINERNRKARADDAAIAEAASKMKKTNAAARKKKPAIVAAADILDTKL